VYEQCTGDIVIRAEPEFQLARSEPDRGRYVWTYTIEIENRGRESVQLLSRHWRITEANGLVHEVRGEGVIGQQPVIEPGEAFRYTSFCPLSAPSGVMVGSYDMIETETGAEFSVAIPPFALDSPFAAKLAN
jgi:ApaG protein